MDQYAVIGYPITHSKSPQIHTAFAQQEGAAIEYRRIEARPENFIAATDRFRTKGGLGLNVTLPHKEAAYRHCTHLNEFAQAAKTVNTISFSANGDWVGANTDGIGLLRDLKINLGIGVENRSILVMGAGGAARGILLPLLQETPQSLVVTNRTVAKAVQLADEFKSAGPIRSRTFEQLSKMEFDIIINATSASLDNQVPPLPQSSINSHSLCYDLAYSDEDTAFLSWCRQAGAAQVFDGLGMLIEQAGESYTIWREFRPDTKPVFDLLRRT